MKGFRIFAAIFAACLLVGGGAIWWLWQNYGGAVTSEFQRIEADARAFAATHEQEDCVPEAFARLEGCEDMWCKIQTPMFTRTCLRYATPTADLCGSVPDSLPVAFLWPAKTCTDIDAEPEICQRILRELVSICFAPSAS